MFRLGLVAAMGVVALAAGCSAPVAESRTLPDQRQVAEQARQERLRHQQEEQAPPPPKRVLLPRHPRNLKAENNVRQQKAIPFACDPTGPDGCARGTWSKLEDTMQLQPDGTALLREVCVPFELPTRKCRTPEELVERERAEKEIAEKSAGAVREAEAACPGLQCKDGETARARIVCFARANDPGPRRVVYATPTCAALAQETANTRWGCQGQLHAEVWCEPAPPPRPVCRAGPEECCMPDGRVVRPCGPVTREGQDCNAPATCGRGGFCNPCRCLPPAARIATPLGDVPVSELSVGDAVLVLDSSGQRRAAKVRRVVRTPVLGSHVAVAIDLSDGRRVVASGPHPLADGRTMAALAAGDRVDGATVVLVAIVPFPGDATWDLVTDAPGAAYFADGVPLRSTLERSESAPTSLDP